jgi:hypothetical protein
LPGLNQELEGLHEEAWWRRWRWWESVRKIKKKCTKKGIHKGFFTDTYEYRNALKNEIIEWFPLVDSIVQCLIYTSKVGIS